MILDDAKVETVPQFFREDGGKSKRRTRPGDWSFRPVDALRANEITVSPPASTSGGPQRGPIAVTYRRPTPERMLLGLDAGRAPALVFVSEGYHPWWRARVDGEPAPVWRAALAHLAVPVEAGPHQVELRFERPVLVAAADAATTIAWIALTLALSWWTFPPGGLRKLRELTRRPEHPVWDAMHGRGKS